MRPHSLVALVLAAGVSAALVALSIGAAWTEANPHGNLSTEASTLLSTALGAAIGAVATYLGARSAGGPDTLNEATSPDELPDRWPPQPTSEYPTQPPNAEPPR